MPSPRPSSCSSPSRSCLAAGAGAAIARWPLLFVPVASGLALSLAASDGDATAAYVIWTIVLELGLAGGIAPAGVRELRRRQSSAG